MHEAYVVSNFFR